MGLKSMLGMNGKGPANDAEEPQEGEVPVVTEGPEPEPEQDSPELARAIEYCDTSCPERESCALRSAFLSIARGNDVLAEDAEQRGDEDTLAFLDKLGESVDILKETRDACAEGMFADHMEDAKRVEEVRPIVEQVTSAQSERLMALEQRIMDQDEKLNSILRALGQQTTAVPPVPQHVERSPLRAPQRPAAAVQHAPVPDGEAEGLYHAFREKYPEDDAEAVRHLLSETGVTQGQVVKFSGKGKATVSEWRNNPSKKATTSLSQERAAASLS